MMSIYTTPSERFSEKSKYYDEKRIEDGKEFHSHEAKMERGKAIHDELQTYSEPAMAAGVTGLSVIVGAVPATAAYRFGMTNPFKVSGAIWTVEGYYGGVPTNTYGSALTGFEGITGIDIVPSWLKP